MKVAKKKNVDAAVVDEQTNPNPEEELSDEDIADTAARMIRERDEEIANLKKTINKQKLIYAAPSEEEEPEMSKEECLKVIGDTNALNYDYAVAVVNLHNRCVENGEDSPLGEDGEAVAELFADIIDRCDGDKTVFPSVYQSMVPADDKQVAAAWAKRYKHN